MTVHREIADHIQAAFVAHWDDQLPVVYTNVAPSEALTDGYATIEIMHLAGEFDAVGTTKIRHTAYITIRVRTPEESGMVVAYQYADSAINFLETYDPPAYAYRARFPTVQELGAGSGFNIIECRATLEYQENT